MFLGIAKLLKLVKEKNLVEGLCQRELEKPEGCGFDLRLGKVYRIKGEGYLGVDQRKTCEIELVAKAKSLSRGGQVPLPISSSEVSGEARTPWMVEEAMKKELASIILNPGDFYLAKTIEKINMPPDLVGILKPRTSLQRMGIFLRTAQVSPGYSGQLTFGLSNLGPCKVSLDLGARIVHLMFACVEGKTALYRGQWQGGRVTTKKKERQV